MPNPPLRAPSEVVHSINKKAATVREAAAAITERIERFQDYLSKLPGRVETNYYGSHPDASSLEEAQDMRLVLRLERRGKHWILSCASHSNDGENYNPDYSLDFKPLTEASLKFKLAAVNMFPHLLEAIERSQGTLTDDLKKAAAEYDKFEATLMPNPKEAQIGLL